MQREAPLFPQAGGCAVRFQVGGIDHNPIRRITFSGQASENPLEDPAAAPANEPIVKGLVRAILLRRVFPLQSVADHIDDPADHPPAIDARLTMRTGKIRLVAVQLWPPHTKKTTTN